jgi:hypothetical protein
MTNKGIEILLRGNLIDKTDLSFDLTLNYANNKSNVVKTDENGNTLQIATGSLFQSNIGAMEGEPFGIIYGNSFVRDTQGRVVHSMVNGVPIPKSESVNKVLGLGVAPTQLGIGGNLRYKDFSLYLFLEGKFGGSIISDTNARMKFLGLHQDTVPAGGREAGFIPDGVMEDGSVITQKIPGNDLQNYWTLANRYDIGEENVYKNDFLRISQLSLSYRVPSTYLQNTFIKSANIALVGNNLGFVFKDVPNIDPEAYYNTRNGQGVEGIAMPIGESVGFSINLKL